MQEFVELAERLVQVPKENYEYRVIVCTHKCYNTKWDSGFQFWRNYITGVTTRTTIISLTVFKFQIQHWLLIIWYFPWAPDSTFYSIHVIHHFDDLMLRGRSIEKFKLLKVHIVSVSQRCGGRRYHFVSPNKSHQKALSQGEGDVLQGSWVEEI